MWACGGSPRTRSSPQNPGLRAYLDNATIGYVMAIPKTTEFTDDTGRAVTINDIPERLRPHTWARRCCGIGTKGYRVYDWVVIDSAHPDHQYMIRRSIDDGELAFYHCHNPRHEPIGELVRVAGTRWPIEECFHTGKGQVGLRNYQVRLYHAWYRHITLAMLAQTFLAILARGHREKKGAPHAATPPTPTPTKRPAAPHRTGSSAPPRPRIRLSLAEIRHLFNLRDQAKRLIHTAMDWSIYRREHQAEARRHHFTRRLKIQVLAL